MELECLRDKLLKVVSVAERLTSKNISLPILQTLFLETNNNQLVIKATNLEIGLTSVLMVKTIKPGKITINAKTFSQLLINLTKADKLKLKSEGNNLIITSKTNKTTLKSFPTEDFPIIPKADGDKYIIKPEYLIFGLRSVIYAGSTSNIKPEISSVYLYYNGQDYVFVSTDSFRLAEKKFSENLTIDFNPLIIPLKSSGEIIRVFENTTEPLTLQSNNHQFFISNKETTLTSSLINGVYPDYQQIIPKQFKTKIITNKDDLTNTLKTNNIFTDRFNQIDLIFKSNSLTINSQNQDNGESSSRLEVKIEGEERELTLNSRYLIDGLQTINQPQVFIGLNEKNKAVFLKGVGDDSFTYLIMPVSRS